MRQLRHTLWLTGLLLLSVLTAGCDEPRRVEVAVGSESLAGLYWNPPKANAPALLLLPMLGHQKEDWIPLADQLHSEGYGVLALDLRDGGRGSREQLLADVRAGFNFLREQKKVDAVRIGLIGASIGANAALLYAAQEPLVRLTVLFSPGLNYRGLATEPALRDYGARPLLLLASEQDLGSATAVRRLASAAQGEAVVKLYPGTAHGTDLLDTGLALAQELLPFLQAYL